MLRVVNVNVHLSGKTRVPGCVGVDDRSSLKIPPRVPGVPLEPRQEGYRTAPPDPRLQIFQSCVAPTTEPDDPSSRDSSRTTRLLPANSEQIYRAPSPTAPSRHAS
jgi:hypothetical protein